MTSAASSFRHDGCFSILRLIECCWSVLDRVACPHRAPGTAGAGRAGPPAPPARAVDRHRRRAGAGLPGSPRAVHQSLLPMGPVRVLVRPAGHPGGPAHHPPGGRVQRGPGPRGRHPARPGQAFREPRTPVGELDVHLAAALGAADRGPALPLQPQRPLPHPEHRGALRARLLHLRRVAAGHRHRRGGRGTEPERSGVRGRGGTGRRALRRPGPARGGGRAGTAQAVPVRPDRLPPGAALHRPRLRQPVDRAGQGHLAGLLRIAARPVRHGAEPRQHLLRRRRAAAAGGHLLVRGPHQRPFGRPVLRRAVLRARCAADRTAHPLQRARTGLRDLRDRFRKETAR